MFSIPGLLGLLVLTYVHPQAFITTLNGVPLIHIVYILALSGFAIDLRLRIIRAEAPPLLWWVIAYFAWSLVTVAIFTPGQMPGALSTVMIRFLLFFMAAQAVQSFRALHVAVITVVAIAGFLSVVGIDQAWEPHGCIEFKSSEAGSFDGRDCDNSMDCASGGEPGTSYRCENIGLFGTHTINGRVRWLGVIEDPNELAMCVSLCIPLLIGLYLLRPTWRNRIILVVGSAAFVLCTFYTKSRGGQLVFLAAMGVYFIRRYGVRGAIVLGLIAAPVLLFGGRSGEEANESKVERLDALYAATDLIRARPIFGVGYNQFTEYHVRTAHNSYAMAGVEMGLPGLFFFLACLYQSLRSFFLVTQHAEKEGPSRPAFIWSGAFLAAQCGLMMGIFFLSFNSSPILWTFLGLCGGFQLAVRRHEPRYSFSLRARDVLIVGALTLGLAAFMFVYSHLSPGS